MLSQCTELCHEIMAGVCSSSMGPWTAMSLTYSQSFRYPRPLGAHKTLHPLITSVISIYIHRNEALGLTGREQGLALESGDT